ncbi:hypothetical protein EG830_15475, partial [bacterium]|nr:hypothetical protein [bacterium]
MRSMNVLYIWDADYPWDIRVEKICSTLASNGMETHILARNLKAQPEYEKRGDVYIHRLRAFGNSTVNKLFSFPAFFNPLWNQTLYRVIRRSNIELIIVRDPPMAIAGIWASQKFSIPVIFDMAEDYVALIKEIWKARKFQGLNLFIRNPYLAGLVERYVLQEADHILVVVDEARDVIIKRGAHPHNVTIVSNTPALNVFHGPAMNDMPGDIDIIMKRYSVIYTGGIQLGRGIQTVIEAIPNIIQE